MVMTKPSSAPIRPADMGRTEAEQVTQAIKDNFDSLGAMLVMARDRKAYRALGYRSFESYCQSEFGKSASSAYQLIEDAKVISQLEAKISENYGEVVTLNFPASHLRPLKAVEDIDDKLKAIEYAQKLAAAENRKATKKDLEIAVFKVSGKRSEDFKNAIEGLGFVKGTPVEVQSPIKKDRGIITRVDKSGKIYVELYYFEAKAMPFNPEELRILSDKERPANPLEGSIASKGDRVLIYATGFEGQKGTIYTWREGKEALVMVDGQNSPINIAYAEMELLKSEQKNSNWEAEAVWNSGKNTYYYLPQENKIHSDLWPTNLAIEPSTHSENPIEFMEAWETEYSTRVLESMAMGNPTRIKTLVLTQAIELPEAQAKEFASDLIASLRQLFWDEIPGSPNTSKLEADRDDLLVRLAEVQNRYISIRKLEVEPLEERINNLESQLRETEKERIATKKELELTIDHSKQGFFQQEISKIALTNETLQIRLAEAEATIEVMIKACENTAASSDEIPSPGDTAADVEGKTDSDVEAGIATELPPNISKQIPSIRSKFFDLIEKYEKSKTFTGTRKAIENLDKNIKTVQGRLKDLEKFEQLRVGQTICHQRQPMILGKIIGLDFSQGEMPIVWIKYFRDGELEKTPTSELVGMILTVNT